MERICPICNERIETENDVLVVHPPKLPKEPSEICDGSYTRITPRTKVASAA